MPSAKSVISRNLTRIRKLRGLSQSELAVAIGQTNQSISNIEKERAWVSEKTLAALAAALGCEESDLLMPVEPPKPLIVEHSIFECLDAVSLLLIDLRAGKTNSKLATQAVLELFRDVWKK